MSDSEKRSKGFLQKTVEFTDKYFPERQMVLRTDGEVRYHRISKRFQISVSAAAIALMGWTAFTSTTHFLHDSELLAKDKEVLSVQVAYRSLLSEVSEYQNKFSSISHELEANHSRLVASLGKDVLDNRDKLVTAEVARKEAQVARRQLNSQLHAIEESMRDLANRNYSLKGDLSLKEMDLQTALAERNTARMQKNRIEKKLRDAEIKMAHLSQSQEDLIKRITEQASDEISDIENILTIAGLDPDKMLSNLDEDNSASGGPFIAAGDKSDADTSQVQFNAVDRHLARWQGLQRIKQSLPLAVPLDYYYISSRYGKRRDPVNKRWAVHYGLDMAASKKSPVYVTAPGKVTFSGWKGNYGRFIVVDHGNGVETRYGHLHKTLVKKGDTVDFRTKIGLVGNSGRSTGAHLHYEVRVNEKNVDPFKFIKAGRNVFQG